MPLRIPLGVVGSSRLEPSEYWFSSISKESYQATQDLAVDSQGFIYHLGYDSDTVGNMVIIKYDSLGSVIWLKEFQTSGREAYGTSLNIDSGDNLLVIGSAYDTNTSNLDFIMLKLTSDGNIVWQKALYDGTNSYNSFHAELGDVDNSNNFYGLTQTSLNPSVNVYVSDRKIVKLNSSGSLQTQKHFRHDGGRELSLSGISVNQSNQEVYSYGNSNEDNFTTGRPVVFKTNSSLSSISWSKELTPSSGYGAVTGLDLDTSGNAYAVWYQNEPSLVSYLTKFNSSGSIQWQRQTDASIGGVFWLHSFVAPDGFIYLYGRDQNVSRRLVIFKYNSSGVLQWQRYIDGAGYVNALRIGMDPSNQLVLSYDRTPDEAYEFGTIRIPADGSLVGTHGGYTYEAGSYTETSFSGSWGNSSVNIYNPGTYSTNLSVSNSNYSEITAAPYSQTRTDIR